MRQKYSPLIWYQFMKSIFSAEWKMPARMVGLLGTLCLLQNIYLIDHYCFRKVVPKVCYIVVHTPRQQCTNDIRGGPLKLPIRFSPPK